MSFQKNNTLSTGRPKGSRNKNTEALRGYLLELLQDNKDQLKDDLKELEPYQRVQTYIQLAKVVLPALRQIDLDANVTNKPMDAIDKILQMSDDQLNELYPDDDQIQ